VGQVIQISKPAVQKQASPAVSTDSVYVVFTSIDETLAAVRVAHGLSEALDVPLTVVHFRTIPFALPVDEPTGLSPVETDAFVTELRSEGVDTRVKVFLCRDERGAIPVAFKPHSVIVMGGRRSWWPTRLERWRRTLEAAGHFVVFVEKADAPARLGAAPSPLRSEPQEASRA
jgi:hypothetical protein